MKFHFSKIEQKEMEKLEWNFSDWTLCTPSNIEPKSYSHYFLIAQNEIGDVAAILKFSKPVGYGEKVWSISWIDVNKKFRGRGLVRKMYRYLNQIVPEGISVIATSPTEDGKRVGVERIRKEEMNRAVLLER